MLAEREYSFASLRDAIQRFLVKGDKQNWFNIPQGHSSSEAAILEDIQRYQQLLLLKAKLESMGPIKISKRAFEKLLRRFNVFILFLKKLERE